MKHTRRHVDPGVWATVMGAATAAHWVGDYIVQTRGQACAKGQPGLAGHRACAAHVASYTATQLVAVYAAAKVSGVRLRAGSVLAGACLSAVTHYVADRRTPLKRAADALGMTEFHDLGHPRKGEQYDDNPCLGTGSHFLDQSWHRGWLPVFSALMARGAKRAR